MNEFCLGKIGLDIIFVTGQGESPFSATEQFDIGHDLVAAVDWLNGQLQRVLQAGAAGGQTVSVAPVLMPLQPAGGPTQPSGPPAGGLSGMPHSGRTQPTTIPIYRSVSINQLPSNHRGEAWQRWISEAVEKLGFQHPFMLPSLYHYGLRTMVDAVRGEAKSANGAIFFVVRGKRFGGGAPAFTPKKDNYNHEAFACVTADHSRGARSYLFAHELCHIFGASDEYVGYGNPNCGCSQFHGFFRYPNLGCPAHSRGPHYPSCLMAAYNSLDNNATVCVHTQNQIGWRMSIPGHLDAVR